MVRVDSRFILFAFFALFYLGLRAERAALPVAALHGARAAAAVLAPGADGSFGAGVAAAVHAGDLRGVRAHLRLRADAEREGQRPARPAAPAAVAPAVVPPSARAPWAETLLRGNNETPASFHRTLALGHAPEPGFWYAVEDTLHALKYIETNEAAVLDGSAMALRRGAEAGEACYVVDVGSNGGYFSLLSRSLGCAVLAIDAQPRCLDRLASSVAVNGWHDGVTTAWTAVGDAASPPVEVGATRCSGLWAVRESDWINAESAANVMVSLRTLDDVAGAWVPLGAAAITALKIDAEGSELAVLQSALGLLRGGRVRAILMEYVPWRVIPIMGFAGAQRAAADLYAAGWACAPVGNAEMYTKNEFLETLSEEKYKTVLVDKWECRPSKTALAI